MLCIRRYEPADCKALAELFCETVHAVNAKDYTKEQLDAWTAGSADLERWGRTLAEHDTVVAVEKDRIVGFADMAEGGCFDRLYVHKDYQNRGIATALCDELEQKVAGDNITVHASITAKPFFLSRGYRVVKEQQVIRQGISLTNFVMEKDHHKRERDTMPDVNKTCGSECLGW